MFWIMGRKTSLFLTMSMCHFAVTPVSCRYTSFYCI